METYRTSKQASSLEEPLSPNWDSNLYFSRSTSCPPPTSAVVRTVECTKQGCGRKFNSHSHRIRHERMHTGEKPFGCPSPSCLKRFSRRDNQIRHYREEGGVTKVIEKKYDVHKPDHDKGQKQWDVIMKALPTRSDATSILEENNSARKVENGGTTAHKQEKDKKLQNSMQEIPARS
jgi:uncharacterized Zn-finger protein